MRRPCDNCGQPYEAKRKTSRFCSTNCRVKNNGRAAAESRAVVAFAHTVLGGEPAGESELVRTTREQLSEAGRLDTYLGRTAIVLATALGMPDTGSARASLSKELRAVMDEAMRGAKRAADPLDELGARRAAKLNTG